MAGVTQMKDIPLVTGIQAWGLLRILVADSGVCTTRVYKMYMYGCIPGHIYVCILQYVFYVFGWVPPSFIYIYIYVCTFACRFL